MSRSAVRRTIALGLVTAVAVGLGTLPAAGAPARPIAPITSTPGSDGDHAASGARALERASTALAAPPSVGPDRRPEPTLALRDLFLARPTLEGEDKEEAGRLLARPTDGSGDPYGDGYSVPANKACGPHVCLHWVSTTRDAPPDRAWVTTNLNVMETMWRHHIEKLGYRRPPGDGNRGGSAKFDVYLKEIGSAGLYGYCTPEKKVQGQPRQATSYCVLDNDFARSQFGRAPKDSLRVTAAHEFFHAVQFAYDYKEDPWLLESTATWMEERAADAVNDNRAYLPYSQIARPGSSLDYFDPSGFGQYGNWIFWEYLSQRFGTNIVRSVIRRSGTGSGLPNQYSTQALKSVLRSHGGFEKLFGSYAAANTIAGRAYFEGKSYPKPGIAEQRTLTTDRRTLSFRTELDHLAARHYRVKPGSSLRGDWRLRVAVDGPSGHTHPSAVLTIKRTGGHYKRRTIDLDADGRGARSLAFSRGKVAHATISLVNASTAYRCRVGSDYACQGRPKDNNKPFSLSLKLSRG